ncbi:MAG: OmpA family protein [Myxococcota bacterium]
MTRFFASETPEDDFAMSRPTDLGHLRYGLQLHVDYANDPLVFETEFGDADSEDARVVAHQLTGNLGLSFGLYERLVIFAGLPVVLVQEGDDEDELRAAGLLTPDGAGLGDVYAGARFRIFGEDDDLAVVGLQATVYFPTAGGSQLLRGEESISIHPELLAEIRGGPARFVLNVGARIREDAAAIDNLGFQDELTFGLGVAAPLWTSGSDRRTHFDLHGQIYGSTEFDAFLERGSTPLEILVGGKFFHQSGLVAGLAGGPGLARGFGSPDFRVLAMLGYMRPERLEGEVAEELPREHDRDGDGLLDVDDECPDEPEDDDDFQDENGCPDPDNDEDGILDDEDECPLAPENVNEWEDSDGCPDEIPDTDGDGLLDNVDQCVNEPEDRDGFEDEDGCPDPDNDQDTVLDVQDNCPNEPGPPENQGCEEEQQVVIREGSLEILDKVYFRTNRDVIQRRSHALLNNVAVVLNNHPEIARVRVEGHTDARGRLQYNMDLSQRRAEAVVRYLIEQGVDSGRLEAQGFGPNRPIVENARSRDEHAQNRRVEFNLIDGGDGIERRDSGAAAQGSVDR